MGLLQPAPERRDGSAEQVFAALDGEMRGSPVPARRPAQEPRRRWAARRLGHAEPGIVFVFGSGFRGPHLTP